MISFLSVVISTGNVKMSLICRKRDAMKETENKILWREVKLAY